ncbi:alpha-tocopherol transfer protein-like isoform X2 [Leptidea sinapis]|uniref:alpha-tocopherol transfer protein-like isoform X2 n=1 Tax=Leptidea sinapis TaxID=189913 RepID=UPI002146BC4C|nr:alpha-tocopherol transfer protein-like isoform X2 [Leptidea sinapis]
MPSGKEFLVEEEYKKGTGITEADVRKLRQWLKTQPHLPEKYITDLDLILAYHACNRSSSVTKEVLDLHYTLKTLFTPYFRDRCVDDDIEQTCSNVLLMPLPTRTKEGDVIFFAKLVNHDPKYYHFQETIKALFLVIDVWQYEEGTSPGLHLVLDYQGVTLRHLANLDLLNLQRFFYVLQEGILLKLKGFHFINAPPFVDKVLTLSKPFMKKELLDKLKIFTAGSKDLEKYLPIEAFPKDSGGNYKSSQECVKDVLAMLRRNKRFIEEENKKRVTESLRPGKPKTIGDIFSGVEGSFKKLEID